MQSNHRMMLFAGNANPSLAATVAEHLGISLGRAEVGTFSDGETRVEILDNVRGRDVFVLQSTNAPANDHLMELILMSDALRRASAARINAVVPYFGYARQDRRVRSARVPITAKVVADLMAAVGISRLLTVDLHADQIQGFFYMPVDNIYGSSIFMEDIQQKQYPNLVVVSPDVGGVVRARAVAKNLNSELAIIDKRRAKANESQVMNVIGDIQNRECILVDDIVDTAGTLCHAAAALKAHGAAKVLAYCIHPVLSGQAIDKIHASALDELVVTDTIPLPKHKVSPKIRQLGLGSLLARVIRRAHEEESISSMFPE